MTIPPKGTLARQHMELLVLCRRVGREIAKPIAAAINRWAGWA